MGGAAWATRITWGCDAPSVAPETSCLDGAGVAFTLGGMPISWQLVGALLFVAVAVVAYWYVALRDDPEGLLLAALLLAVAFFALPTRVHERYMFPALALAAPLVIRRWPISRSWLTLAVAGAATLAFLLYLVPPDPSADATRSLLRPLVLVVSLAPMVLAWSGGAGLYVLLSASFFANVYWVYTADWSFAEGPVMNPGVGGLPMQRDPFLASTLFSDHGIYAMSGLIVVVLAVLIGWAVANAWQPASASQPAAQPMPAEGSVGGLAGIGSPVADAWQRLIAWLRPDRGDPYLREPRRRLDRLDLALVIGLVLFAFLFRLWRLDTPRSMHFDEVYHGRSATEWLADWQEGWTRDTYEWTHPMLAKYLIAAGIVVADPNKVIAQASTGEPWTRGGGRFSAAGERHFGVGRLRRLAGGLITARSVLGGQVVAEWPVDGEVASLAFDADNDRLLVGLAQARNRADLPDARLPPLERYARSAARRTAHRDRPGRRACRSTCPTSRT